MADLSHFYGGDLAVSSAGDVATVSGAALGTQRVLRRLLTNPGDYIFEPDYGAGIARFVGQAVPIATVVATIRAQIFLEAAVARNPDPVITVTPIPDGLAVNIRYTDATTGAPQLLDFDVTP
jgi:hypothetical protein